MRQKDIATALNVSEPTVSRVVAKLRQRQQEEERVAA
jgi:uncharacterized membrane protein